MSNICIDNFIVTFFSGKKEYRSLSNFWENDIIIYGKNLLGNIWIEYRDNY